MDKVCISCGAAKDTSCFYKREAYRDGFTSTCKACAKEQSKTYKRTKVGLVYHIYSHQKCSSKTRGHPIPKYTKDELKDWLYSKDEFHKMYDLWRKSTYEKNSRPSIDRIDDNIGYAFNNIQLTTWKVNNEKGYQDVRSGKLINNGMHAMRAVKQVTTNGLLIKTFKSIADASRATGACISNITRSCKSTNRTAGGFAWEYLLP